MSVIVLVSVDCLSDCLFFQGGFLNLLIYLQCHRPESTKLLGFDITVVSLYPLMNSISCY